MVQELTVVAQGGDGGDAGVDGGDAGVDGGSAES